VMLETDEAIMR